MNLLEAWANWKPDSAPFVLEGDRALLNSQRSATAIVNRRGFREAYEALAVEYALAREMLADEIALRH